MSLPISPSKQSSASISLDNKTNQASQLLSLSDISYDIGSQRLLSHINIDIAVNETVSLIGPNGAGKSTLVKLILGLIEPTKGQMTPHHKLQLGYVPQRFAVPPILPLRVCDLLAQADKKRLTAEQRQFIFDNLSLTHLLSRQMLHLSGGETQRVLLARALLDKPNLLILDEPMQGLDPDTEVWLYQFIDELPDFLRCAMLVVSHDLHWVMKGSRRVICLNKHICCEGQPSELAISSEFQKLFGHHYEQPYVHQPHACEHHAPSEL
ncbi:metal ABC transporter ATP-binding protein [Psychrobacter glaciei]|uniref:metal ABC transporter ATP-binding protein n=1 Tax=Psychrobacter glaciei TaxID=619771 RepID=UPI001F05E166|nr:metal ABC transporter ATP-binding protein [Psychrobacter glaciei]MCH1783658.1 metal ABC transporter ATP-binding protein [Psychrobacter glaciei]